MITELHMHTAGSESHIDKPGRQVKTAMKFIVN